MKTDNYGKVRLGLIIGTVVVLFAYVFHDALTSMFDINAARNFAFVSIMQANLWWIALAAWLLGAMSSKLAVLKKVALSLFLVWLGFFIWAGVWAQQGVQAFNNAVACRVDDSTMACAEYRANQAEERQIEQQEASIAHQRQLDLIAARNPPPALTKPVGAPEAVTVPRCGGEQDWVVVNIPAGWGFTPAYQREIATPQFLFGTRWLSSLEGVNTGIVAARYCTNELFWAGKEMTLTWKRVR